MNNDPIYARLLETSWRRNLTDAELHELEMWLAAHPECRVEWEQDAAFNELMNQLPDVPVPSNFTARVLDAARREEERRVHSSARRWSRPWQKLLPWAALSSAAALVALLAVEHTQVAKQRTQLAHNLAASAALQNPDDVRDFDTIRHLKQISVPDDQLLALLQQQ